MEELRFDITRQQEFQFAIGGSQPSPGPQPEPSGTIIIGTPVVRMSGVVVPISSTIYGTAEEVE